MAFSSRKASLADSPLAAHVLIGLIFLAMGAVFVIRGLTPAHDAIGIYGLFHYFCDSLNHGILPLWNPYSQTGKPFYIDFQALGLWEPSTYAFVVLQKITGCSTLTAYISHYLFYYAVFISGAYSVFRMAAGNSAAGLLFCLVLLLGTFPSVMRENGAIIPFFLVPHITFFLFRFFEETRNEKKGPYFFLSTSLGAAACLNYIPSYLFFYLLFFVILAFALRVADAHDIARWAKSRSGLSWIGASVGTAALILAPLLAFYVDIKSGGELLPFSRMLLASGFRLPRMFSSDMGLDVFSSRTMRPVSMTLGNLRGLLLEPWAPHGSLQLSEMRLYAGILPILCAGFFLRRIPEGGRRRARLLLAMAGVTLLMMSNFKGRIDAPPSAAQRLLIAAVPTLDKVEVFELFGTLFLFCLLAAAAAGFAAAEEEGSVGLWRASAIAWGAKYLLLFLYLSSPGSSGARFFAVAAAIAGLFCVLRVGKAAAGKLRWACIALLFSELLLFNAVHIGEKDKDKADEGTNVQRQFYDALKREHILPARREGSFINYRKPWAEGCIYTFHGHEILSAEKVALPGFFNRFAYGCNVIDSIFCTRSYYDYLVNVGLGKQLAGSSVIYPILNFYPAGKAIAVPSARAAAAAMNASSLAFLGEHIFIEREDGAGGDLVPSAFSPGDYLNPTLEEIEVIRQKSALKLPGYRGFNPRIDRFDANVLSAAVQAPEDGYFFFGDGWSRHWKAFLDGRRVKIEKTNVNFKSVFMSRGGHRVDFIYDPVTVRYAMLLSVFGTFLAILLALTAIFPRAGFLLKSRR